MRMELMQRLITVGCFIYRDVNESMKYVHKTSKRAHSGAAMNCNPH